MQLNIITKTETDEVRLALTTRASVLRAKIHHTSFPVVKASAGERLRAVEGLLNQITLAPVEPQYQYLNVGELIREGDEVKRHSPYEGETWAPCRATIGRDVRSDERFQYRRPSV